MLYLQLRGRYLFLYLPLLSKMISICMTQDTTTERVKKY